MATAAGREVRRPVLSEGFAVSVALGCVVGLFVFGGASRSDSFALVFARGISVIAIGLLMLGPVPGWWRPAKRPLLFTAAVALLIVVQLIPLPPALWQALPGRLPFAQLSVMPELADVWRPIALQPDRALNVLVSLLPVLAAIILTTLLPVDLHRMLVMLLIGLIVLSGLVGMMQLIGGGSPALYPHRVTNIGSAVGLFANRNHQALALALGFPLLAAWTVQRRNIADSATDVPLLFVGILFVSLILITGSRAGLLLMVGGIAGAILLLFGRRQGRRDKRMRILAWLLPLAAVLVAVGLMALTNAESTRRFFSADVVEDTRAVSFGPIVDLIRTYFPFGSGFGSFADVFKTRETLDMLQPTYLNHAHDDLLEVLLDGGLFAGLLLAAFLFWWVRATFTLWVRVPGPSRHVDYGKAGSVLTALVLVGSLVDYPLRTPAIAMIFVIACCWMEFGANTARTIRSAQGRANAAV